MPITDPIADMLTRIRNAIMAQHEEVYIPGSGAKNSIADVLKREGYIRNYEFIEDNKQGKIRILLKTSEDGTESVIKGLKRISRPGLRMYVRHNRIPRVLNGLGIAIISTSHGILTDRECREKKIGGEVLCYVW